MVRTPALLTPLLLIALVATGCATPRTAADRDVPTNAALAEGVLADDPRFEPLIAFLEAENLTVLEYFSQMPPIRSEAESVYRLMVRSPEAVRTPLMVYVYPSEEAAREELRRHPNFRILEQEYTQGAGRLRSHPSAYQSGSLVVTAPLLDGALRRSLRQTGGDEHATTGPSGHD